MHSEREHYTPTFCMHHCINTGQLTVITAVFPARQLQPAASSIPSSDPDCRQRVTRGRGRGFLETRTKSDTKSRGRVARGQGWPESDFEHKASSSSGNKQAAGQTRGRFWRPETLLNLDANFALKSYQEARQHYIT